MFDEVLMRYQSAKRRPLRPLRSDESVCQVNLAHGDTRGRSSDALKKPLRPDSYRDAFVFFQ